MLRIVAGFTISAALLAGVASNARADACMCAPDANVTSPEGAPVLILLAEDDSRRDAPLQDDVLWCIDGDDPRCAPAGGGEPDPSQTVSTSSPSGGLAEDDAVADPDVHDVRYADDAVGPRMGARYRVERPPR